jgi:titin
MVAFGPGIVFSDPVAHVVRYLAPDAADLSGDEGVLVGNGSSGLPVAGPATSSPMISPTGLAFDEQNEILYIADTGANMVVAVSGLLSPGTPQLSIVAGTGVAGSPDFTYGAAAGLVSKLNGPRAVAVSDDGNQLAIADTGNNSVYSVLNLGGEYVLFPLVGPGAPACYDGAAVVPPTASGPRGLFWDGDGSLLVADTGNHRVMIGTFGDGCSYEGLAGTGVAGAVTEGPATESKLSAPVSISVAFTGGVFIADEGNHQLISINYDLELSIVGGTGSADPIDVNATTDPTTGSLGSISQATFAGYAFFLVDSTNNIFVSMGQASAPSTPTTLSATPGNGSASVSFNAPTDNGGRAITKYQYKVGSGAWTDAVGTTSPITITGLTNFVSASIKLRAVNSIGNSAASVAVSVTPRLAGPAAPSATPSGLKGFVVRFNLNPLPGTTVAYQSVVAYARGTNTVKGTCRTYGKQTTCYIGGLTRATDYDLRVTAHLPVPGKTWHSTTQEGAILQVRTNG